MWFEASQDGRSQAVISLPGVPYEMKGLVQEEVMPRVLAKWELPLGTTERCLRRASVRAI